MNVLFNGNDDAPEFEISATGPDLADLGQRLQNIKNDIFIRGSDKTCSIYSCTLKGLIFELKEDVVDEVDVKLEHNALKFVGNEQALKDLGQSLLIYFEDDPNDQDHFHLDYFEGNMILKPTNFSIVFMCVEARSETKGSEDS